MTRTLTIALAVTYQAHVTSIVLMHPVWPLWSSCTALLASLYASTCSVFVDGNTIPSSRDPHTVGTALRAPSSCSYPRLATRLAR